MENNVDNYWRIYIPFFGNWFHLSPYRRKLISLIHRNDITITAEYRRFTYKELEILHKTMTVATICTSISYDGQPEDMAFMFLFYHGYLTLADDFHPRSNAKFLRMRIPNNHTHEILQWKYIYDYSVKLRIEETPDYYLKTQLKKFLLNNETTSVSLERAFEYFIRLHERVFGIIFTNKMYVQKLHHRGCGHIT